MTLPLFPDLLVYDLPLPDGPSPYYLACMKHCFVVVRVPKVSES